MAGIFATAGARLFIGEATAAKTVDFVQADFTAQSFIPIGWVENLGAFGDESTSITFDAIEQQRTQKLKGTRNAGDMTLVCGIDYEDIGQIALRDAEKVPNNFSFKVVFNDKPSGGVSGSIRYFIALVMSVRETLDTANNVMKLNTTLGINSNIVSIAAA